MTHGMRLFRIAALLSAAILHGEIRNAAAQVTWDGSDSEFWHIADNWTSNAVPDSSDNVTVGAPAPTVVDSGAVFGRRSSAANC